MKWSPDTLFARVGTEPDDQTRALSPSIQMASTFARPSDGHPSGEFVYSRLGNPTREKLETALAEMEGGEIAFAFSSGMAAANALLQTLSPGDTVLMPHDIYFGIRQLATHHFGKWGLVVDTIDMSDLEAVKAALSTPTTLVWLETPSNPQLNITDLSEVISLSKKAGARTVVDSTWCTPLITKPLDMGADVVLHSVTKYFGGHSDLLGGALICRSADDWSEQIHAVQKTAGAVLDPFSCWLTMRGLRSLPVRLQRQCESAMQVAQFLSTHPNVEGVHYPGLPTDPGFEVARKQMTWFGGMLSFRVKASERDAIQFASNLHLFAHATSLGGTESLIEHRASIEGPDSLTPRNLLRVSVGLESAEDLIEDLRQGLNRLV